MICVRTIRQLVLFAVVALVVGFAAGNAFAERQPHMQAALRHLESAKGELQDATADKGGHRERALNLVNDAIDQVQKGIDAGK